MITTITLNPAIDKIYLVDDFRTHKLHRLHDKETTITQPGGKGVNIAITLKRLGIDNVIAMGFAGGHAGRMLTEEIRKEGVTTNFIHVEPETRTDVSIIDNFKNTLTEINESGREVEAEDLEMFIDNYKKVLNRTKYVVIAGSMPPGVPRDFYGKLVALAKEYGCKPIVHAAPDLTEIAIKEGPYLINPDMRSNHTLFGKQIDGVEQFIEEGRRIIGQSKDIEIVIFSHRIENVVAVTRKNAYVLRPKNLKIVNMLGYGDAGVAGFIYALYTGMSEAEALRFGWATALTNVESIDKQTGDIEQVKKNLDRLELEVF